MKKYLPTLLICTSIFIFYFPVLVYPNLLLARGNDLQQQFWPVFYYIRQNFVKFHQIPLWNNLFFSGTPLLPDPQFSPAYPANLLFAFLPTNMAFFAFFILHSLLAAFTSYTLAKKGLNFSVKASIFFSLIYITTPKLAGYLEAGHYGLFAAHAWIPLVILAIINLSKKADLKNTIIFGISFSGIYFTHTVIFLLALPASLILFLILIILNKKNKIAKKIIFMTIAISIGFGLSAVTFLPQLNWIPNTTRNLLSIHPDVYPNWNSINEFFSNLFLINHSAIPTIDEEKWITLGVITLGFAMLGFIYLSRKIKLLALLILFGLTTLILNNLSPLYPTLLFENWYQLMRVTTRFWFIPGTILLILAAFGFEKLAKSVKSPLKILVYGLAIFCILENLYIGELRITKKPIINNVYVQNDLLDFLKKDNSQFRIFCTTRCVSQQGTALNDLELVEGYNTLQQLNYYEITKSMMGGSWDYYTLPIPPSGIGKLNPNAELLGEYNVKYVISPYKLQNNNFVFLGFYKNNFYLYKNNLFKPRSNQNIVFYSPNFIKINIKDSHSNLILRDVYSLGWHAYENGNKELKIIETQNAQREVNFTKDTKFITFAYMPEAFKMGIIITLITIFFITLSILLIP